MENKCRSTVEIFQGRLSLTGLTDGDDDFEVVAACQPYIINKRRSTALSYDRPIDHLQGLLWYHLTTSSDPWTLFSSQGGDPPAVTSNTSALPHYSMKLFMALFDDGLRLD